MVYKAEYIWVDGTQPTAKLRSKTKIIEDGKELPIWGFDGSSTNQATGDKSDCVLKPVASFPDPLRGGDDVLVLCEVYAAGEPKLPGVESAALAEAILQSDEALIGLLEAEFPEGLPGDEEDEDAVQTVKIRSGTQAGETVVVRGAGVPRLNGRGRGDLVCVVEVEVPKRLSREQKRLLKELEQTFEQS